MHGSHIPIHRTVLRTYQQLWYSSDQLESRLATLNSSQEALLQVMSVNEINTVKSAQWKSVKMPSARKTNQQPAPSRSHISSMSLPTVRQARHLHLIVFQLLVRCVHPRAMRHPRTWSAVARSLTVVSSSDCISACITVSMIIVDGLVDKHKEQVFPKDEFTESMIS